MPINFKTNKLRNLIQYQKALCGARDSLSWFVEYIGNNQVRVYRQFYNHSQFINFFIEHSNDVEQLDLRNATNDIGIDEFKFVLEKLFDKPPRYDGATDFIDKIHDINKEYRFEIRQENLDEYIERYLDDINDVFCQYYYSISDRRFRSDKEVYDRISQLTEETNYNPDIHYEDYIDKPEIKPVREDELYELRVYNVGQANCSALIKYSNDSKDDYKVVVVFDLGYQKSFGKNASLNEMINKIDHETTILISHFDNDHINNITDHLKITTNRWLFPKYDGKKLRALKTYQALQEVAKRKTYSGKLYSFIPPYSFSENISVHQYLGRHIGDKYQSTLMNSQCLVCKISINEIDVLIPADALYEEFGVDLLLENNKKYDYILAPHHCCKYIDKMSAPPSLNIWNFIGDKTTGIVMCGNNKYGHANYNHLNWYNNNYLFRNSCIYDDNKNLIKKSYQRKEDFYKISFEKPN